MRNINYWLRLTKRVIKPGSNEIDELEVLISESNELKRILGSIVTKVRKNSN